MNPRHAAVVLGVLVGCTGTIGSPRTDPADPSDPSRPPPRGSEVLPPDPPGFLLLPDGEPALLQLDSSQLRAHVDDVLGLELDPATWLEWTSVGGVLPAEQFRGLHAVADSGARALSGDHALSRCDRDLACARTWLAAVLPELQRAEPTPEALDALLEVYAAWHDAGGARGAVHGLVSAMLTSPLTLIQHERMVPRLGWSLRNLLLWNTPSADPSDDPIDDPRFRRHVEELLRVWLALPPPRHLRRTLEDGSVVSEDAKREAFDAMVDRVVEVVREGGAFEDLFSYGERRVGILGEPYVLLAHSASDHRSIVYRGLFVHRQLLCQNVAFPSASILEEIADTLEAAEEGTTQVDFMIAREANERCAVCHGAFDGLGLALIDFSMFGELDPEPSRDVSVSMALPTWLEESAPRVTTRNPEDLAALLGASSVARGCFSRAWIDAMSDGDPSTVDLESFGTLVEGVLESHPLRDVLETYATDLEP